MDDVDLDLDSDLDTSGSAFTPVPSHLHPLSAIASLIRWAIEAMEAERERRVSLQLACDKALVEERQARQRQASAALEAERVRRITVLREVEELTCTARAAQVSANSPDDL